MQQLNKEQTLACFGNYYRKDVLGNPENTDHANIRNFMLHGWNGITFEGEALAVIASNSVAEVVHGCAVHAPKDEI